MRTRMLGGRAPPLRRIRRPGALQGGEQPLERGDERAGSSTCGMWPVPSSVSTAIAGAQRPERVEAAERARRGRRSPRSARRASARRRGRRAGRPRAPGGRRRRSAARRRRPRAASARRRGRAGRRRRRSCRTSPGGRSRARPSGWPSVAAGVDGELGGGAERGGEALRARREAGGRDEDEPAHAVGMARGGGDRDGAAERVPDEVEALEPEAVDERVGDVLELEAGAGGVALAEAGDVDGDHAAPAGGQRAGDVAPDQPARGDAVQEDERVALARAPRGRAPRRASALADRRVVGHELALAALAGEVHDHDAAGLDAGDDALAERGVDDVVADAEHRRPRRRRRRRRRSRRPRRGGRAAAAPPRRRPPRSPTRRRGPRPRGGRRRRRCGRAGRSARAGSRRRSASACRRTGGRTCCAGARR